MTLVHSDNDNASIDKLIDDEEAGVQSFQEITDVREEELSQDFELLGYTGTNYSRFLRVMNVPAPFDEVFESYSLDCLEIILLYNNMFHILFLNVFCAGVFQRFRGML